MLHGQFHVDLPSVEALRKMTHWERLTAAFGADHAQTRGLGFDQLTTDSLTVLHGVVEGLRAAGIDDAICLSVDRELIYVDTEHRRQDLPHILDAAASHVSSGETLGEMHLVLALEEDDLDYLFDLRIRGEVPLSQEELVITASAHIKALSPRPGEQANEYAERILAFVMSKPLEGFLDHFRIRLETLGKTLGDVLEGAPTRFAATTHLTLPRITDLQSFVELPFGAGVEAPSFNFKIPPPLPGYDDLFRFYYPDRYHHLTSFLLLQAMFDGVWCEPFVHVLNRDGVVLFSGDTVPEDHALGRMGEHIHFSSDSIDVDPALTQHAPDLSALPDDAERRHPLHEAIHGPVRLRRRSYIRGDRGEHFTNIDGVVGIRKG